MRQIGSWERKLGNKNTADVRDLALHPSVSFESVLSRGGRCMGGEAALATAGIQ